MGYVRFQADDGAFEAMRDQFIDPLMDELGRAGVEAAQRRAPVSKRKLSGDDKHLRDTIHAKVADHKLRIMADAEYAADVEVGNKDYPLPGGGSTEIPARPYLRPTIYDDLKAKFR